MLVDFLSFGAQPDHLNKNLGKMFLYSQGNQLVVNPSNQITQHSHKRHACTGSTAWATRHAGQQQQVGVFSTPCFRVVSGGGPLLSVSIAFPTGI